MFKIKDVMVTDVITARRDTPVYEAVEAMVKHNITGMPVVNDDMEMVGILSEKDVLTLLYTIDDEAKVEDFMTKKLVSFDQEESILEVTDCFVKNNFRRVPVTHKGKLVGIISRKNLVEYILKIRQDGKLRLSLRSIHRQRKW